MWTQLIIPQPTSRLSSSPLLLSHSIPMSNHVRPILEAYDLYVRYYTTFTNPGPLFEVIDNVLPSSYTVIDGKTVREPSGAWRISGASHRRPKGSSSELVMLWIRQLNEVSNARRSVCIFPNYDGNRVSKIIVSKVDPSDIEEFEDLRTFLFPLSFDMMTGELVEKKFYHQDLIAALKDQKNHVLLVGPPGEASSKSWDVVLGSRQSYHETANGGDTATQGPTTINLMIQV
ncbi:hypothetical protein CTheo_4568 [Ceratobasidium theobromae]|uniref:Uncharacterized protein n=1 Tax=Ceratobasidium theobromae TaxID=1582974 RepID=A0A5N5QJQ5_9AGAM|nr:hypothetical protein CTheo_4568 [Ceratobasidium theobromae]